MFVFDTVTRGRPAGHLIRNGRPGLDEHCKERVCPLATGPAGGAAAAEGNGNDAAVPNAVHDPNLQYSKEKDRIHDQFAYSNAPEPSSGVATAPHSTAQGHIFGILVTAVELNVFSMGQGGGRRQGLLEGSPKNWLEHIPITPHPTIMIIPIKIVIIAKPTQRRVAPTYL